MRPIPRNWTLRDRKTRSGSPRRPGRPRRVGGCARDLRHRPQPVQDPARQPDRQRELLVDVNRVEIAGRAGVAHGHVAVGRDPQLDPVALVQAIGSLLPADDRRPGADAGGLAALVRPTRTRTCRSAARRARRCSLTLSVVVISSPATHRLLPAELLAAVHEMREVDLELGVEQRRHERARAVDDDEHRRRRARPRSPPRGQPRGRGTAGWSLPPPRRTPEPSRGRRRRATGA